VLEDPTLEGKPVVVGGRPEGRGVIAAASYPARAFGVRSAMPTSRALALCPELVIVSPRHRVYADYSSRVMDILRQHSPLVEPMSIDEAFLDLTEQVAGWSDAPGRAASIQERVRDEVGLSASLGVATNKLIAKVASDRDKPGGLTVVRPGEEAAFLAPLPVRVLMGIGPVTAGKLAQMGVETVGQLIQVPEHRLRARFGSHGSGMARMAAGKDRRPIVTSHLPRSVSHERTFARDLTDEEALLAPILEMSRGVAKRLVKSELNAGTVAIKIRYSDFTTLTRQMTLQVPTSSEHIIYDAAATLLRREWQPGRPVRLLGVAGRHLVPSSGQLPLW
jgi:DNA polymerase-4